MSDELLNCPFCGSDDVGLSRLHESRSFVMCNGCGAEANDTNTLPEASAADVWNRRVDDPLRTQLGNALTERDRHRDNAEALRDQLAAMTAERDQWRCLLDNVIRMHPDADDDGNAPGHSHSKPGIWDDDNKPAIRGTACQWCHVWNVARNALEATK